MKEKLELSSRPWPFRKAPFLVTALPFSLLLVQQALTAPTLQRGDTGLPRFAYLVECGGAYVKVDISQYEIVSHGRIWDGPSTSSIRPDRLDRFEGCLFNNAEHDAQRGLVYAVVQKHALSSPQGDNEFWIAALQLPNFALVSKAGPFESFPWLLLEPQADNLLVWNVDTIEEYRTPDLQKLETHRNPSGRVISDPAFFMNSGEILDGDRVLDRRGNETRRVRPNALLTPAIKEALRQQLASGIGSQQDFEPIRAGTNHNQMLFLVNPDTRQKPADRSGLLIYDLEHGETLRPITVPYRAAPTTIHLVDNASVIAIEEYEWRTNEATPQVSASASSRSERFKTGTIAVHDATDGRMLRTITLEPTPGFLARVIAFSPDGTRMLYGSRAHIYIADLAGSAEPQALPTTDGFLPNQQFPPLAVFFSDR
jgi:hypothetical protein